MQGKSLDISMPEPLFTGVPFERIRANQYGISTRTLGQGSLLIAKYGNWKHDPYPLILVSSLYSDGRLGGINLHYLTFKFIKNLLQRFRLFPGSFSFRAIKGDKYIANAYRTYHKNKLTQAKLLNIDFLLTILGSIRSFSPNEIERMRREIEKQLRQQVNPRAADIAELQQITPQKGVDTFTRPGISPEATTPTQPATIPTTPTG